VAIVRVQLSAVPSCTLKVDYTIIGKEEYAFMVLMGANLLLPLYNIFQMQNIRNDG
jgi:hypothetical protein